jgi:hypothetical protein
LHEAHVTAPKSGSGVEDVFFVQGAPKPVESKREERVILSISRDAQPESEAEAKKTKEDRANSVQSPAPKTSDSKISNVEQEETRNEVPVTGKVHGDPVPGTPLKEATIVEENSDEIRAPVNVIEDEVTGAQKVEQNVVEAVEMTKHHFTITETPLAPAPVPRSFHDVRVAIHGAGAERTPDNNATMEMVRNMNNMKVLKQQESRNRTIQREAEEEALRMKQLKRLEDKRRKQEVERQRHLCKQRIIERTAARKIKKFLKSVVMQRREKEHRSVATKTLSEARRARVFVMAWRKWLQKTEGRRALIRRLAQHPGLNANLFHTSVCAIQRCFRVSRAKDIVKAMRHRLNDDRMRRILGARRMNASMVVQKWWRVVQSRRILNKLKGKKYDIHARVIQKWAKERLARCRTLRNRNAILSTKTKCTILVQKTWRGFYAKVQCSILRLARRVEGMRQVRVRAVVVIQRIFRGYRGRKYACAHKIKVKSQQESRAIALLKAEVKDIRAQEAAEAAARLASEEQEYQGVVARMGYAEKHKEYARQLFLDNVVTGQALEVRTRYGASPGVIEQALRSNAFQEVKENIALQHKRHQAALFIAHVYRKWKSELTLRGRERYLVLRRQFKAQHACKREKDKIFHREMEDLRHKYDAGAPVRAVKEEWARSLQM